jgi:hypothetical protein
MRLKAAATATEKDEPGFPIRDLPFDFWFIEST